MDMKFEQGLDEIAKLAEYFRKNHSSYPVSQKEINKRQIDATDAKIDRIVYELYGLTEEEIKIVEGEC